MINGATKNRAFWLAHPICGYATSAEGMPAIMYVCAPKIAGREAEPPQITENRRRRIAEIFVKGDIYGT